MTKSNIVYLRHILDAIIRIEGYVEGIEYKTFVKNNLLQAGLIREIEIIGEATKRLNNKIFGTYTNIPWKNIAGMRDKLIHDYFGVDMDAVWDTIFRDIPELKKNIINIIEREKDELDE